MSRNLPLHPSNCHPLTGEPIRAIYVDSHGRARYPIMGGAPDDGAGDGDAAAKAAADAAAKATAEAATKAAEDAAAAKAAEDAETGGAGDDHGFPKDTPVAEMRPAEREAYHRYHARKHEDRSKDWSKAAGVKSPEELAALVKEHAELKQASMTDGEKAVTEAEAKGRRAASLDLAPQLFDLALRHVDEDRRKVLIDTIDMSRVLTESGAIDTDKVSTIAETLAPADTGSGGRGPDYGAGPRRHQTSSGVAAGRAAYESRKKK